MEKIPMDEIKRDLKSVGLSDEAIKELLHVLSIKSLSKLEEVLGASGDAVADLKQLFNLADKFGYSDWIQFDASVVRGLAYYTGVDFKGFDREGKLRAICGGGSMIGYHLHLKLLKEKELLPELNRQVESIVCPLDQELQGSAVEVATILRLKGKSVDLVLENKPLKWVFKRAARINAEWLILVGNSEWQKGMVCVKIPATGEQSEVKLEQLA